MKKHLRLMICAAWLAPVLGCGESLPPPPAPGDTSNMTDEEIAGEAAFQKNMEANIAKQEARAKAAERTAKKH